MVVGEVNMELIGYGANPVRSGLVEWMNVSTAICREIDFTGTYVIAMVEAPIRIKVGIVYRT